MPYKIIAKRNLNQRFIAMVKPITRVISKKLGQHTGKLLRSSW